MANDPTNLGSADNFIQNTVVTEKNPIVSGIDSFMNWLVHEGIPGAAGRFKEFMGDQMSKGVEYVANNMDAPSTPSGQTVPNMSEAKKADVPEIGQSISPELGKMAQMAVGMPSFAMADMDGHNHNFSPTATPGLGVAAQSYGMSVV